MKKEQLTIYLEKDLRSSVLATESNLSENQIITNLIKFALPYAEKYGHAFLNLEPKQQEKLLELK